jgi:type I restriction enzyme M protein
VWFYDMDADGWSLDDKRQPLLPEEKLGPIPSVALSEDDHAKNNLPDVIARWSQCDISEKQRPRTSQSFCMPAAIIASNGYDLSINSYREVVHDQREHVPPQQILAELAALERDIQGGLTELERILQ